MLPPPDPRPRDQYGRFAKANGTIDDTEARRPTVKPGRVTPTVSIGAGGTAIFSGYVESIEKDARLTGRQRYKTFSDILSNVSVVAAGVRYFLNLVSKAGWKVEPADDSPRAAEIAEMVEEMMEDMATPWHRIIRRASMFRFYGFSVQEWTAKKREDGTFGMADVEARPQITIEQWDTDRTGTVLGVVQRSPQTQEELAIPREKLVYLVDDSLNDSPEGLGLFRHLVEPAARLRRYEQLEGFGYEGDLRGIPVVRGPFTMLAELVQNGGISESAKDALEKPLRDFVNNHIKSPALGLALDSQTWQTTDEKQTPSSVRQWDVELLDGGEYSLAEVANAIQRVNLEMARVLGVEHLLLGSDGQGSLALSRDKSHNFGLIVDSTLKEIREAFQTDWVRPLASLNGWPDELVPTLKTEQVQYRDTEMLADTIAKMAQAGVIFDREDEAVLEILDQVGLSRLLPQETDPDAQLVGPEPVPANEPAPAEDEMPEDDRDGDEE